jgi:hypothetical protein
MGLYFSHVAFVCVCAAVGMFSFSIFLFLLSRSIAVGNRKNRGRLELSHRLTGFIQTASDQTGHPLSDCPALSELLTNIASTGIVGPGMELVVPNSPHSPLVLEIIGPSGNDESTQLVAYYYRFVESRLFRETEMAFEICQEGHPFSLKAIRYLPANPQYLRAFAMLWSDELIKKGYLEAVKSRFVIANAA